jgi:hypothetical protein
LHPSPMTTASNSPNEKLRIFAIESTNPQYSHAI